jgi:phosphoglycolate phosphatase-like HAD superfamily hydrolase
LFEHRTTRPASVYSNTMLNPKLIIFDFDGVIQDSWAHSYDLNLKDWPGLTPESHKNFFNGNIHEEFAKMPPSIRDKEEKRQWMKDHYYPTKHELPLFDGIKNVLETLSKHYTLIINTSATEDSTQQYLDKTDLSKFFDKIYGYEVSANKVEKFKKILNDYKVEADETIFITDTVGDVLEAEVCAIPSLVVTYGYQGRSYFSKIEDRVVGFADKPEDIFNFIKI